MPGLIPLLVGKAAFDPSVLPGFIVDFDFTNINSLTLNGSNQVLSVLPNADDGTGYLLSQSGSFFTWQPIKKNIISATGLSAKLLLNTTINQAQFTEFLVFEYPTSIVSGIIVNGLTANNWLSVINSGGLKFWVRCGSTSSALSGLVPMSTKLICMSNGDGAITRAYYDNIIGTNGVQVANRSISQFGAMGQAGELYRYILYDRVLSASEQLQVYDYLNNL